MTSYADHYPPAGSSRHPMLDGPVSALSSSGHASPLAEGTHYSLEQAVFEAEAQRRAVERELRQATLDLEAERAQNVRLRRENRQQRRQLLGLFPGGLPRAEGSEGNAEEEIEGACAGRTVVVAEDFLDRVAAVSGGSRSVAELLLDMDREIFNIFQHAAQLTKGLVAAQREREEAVQAATESDHRVRQLRIEVNALLAMRKYVPSTSEGSDESGLVPSQAFEVPAGTGRYENDREHELSVLLARSTQALEGARSELAAERARTAGLEGDKEAMAAVLAESVAAVEVLHATVAACHVQLREADASSLLELVQTERRLRIQAELAWEVGAWSLRCQAHLEPLLELQRRTAASDVRACLAACEDAKRGADVAATVLAEQRIVSMTREAEGAHHRYEGEFDALRRANHQLRMHIEILQKNCDEWRRQSERRSREMAAEASSLRQSLGHQLSTAQADLDAQSRALADLTAQHKQLLEEATRLRAKTSVRTFPAATQSSADDYLDVSEKGVLDRMVEARDAATAEARAAQQSLLLLEQRLESAQGEHKLLEMVVVACEREKQTSEGRAERAEGDLRRATAELQGLHAAHGALRREATDLEADLRDADQTVAELERKLVGLAAAARSEGALAAAGPAIAPQAHKALQDNLAARAQEVADLRAQVHALQAEVVSSRAEASTRHASPPPRAGSVASAASGREFFSPLSGTSASPMAARPPVTTSASPLRLAASDERSLPPQHDSLGDTQHYPRGTATLHRRLLFTEEALGRALLECSCLDYLVQRFTAYEL